MNLNLILCDNLELPAECCTPTKSKKSKGSKVNNTTDIILDDINQLLMDSNFNRNYICTHILNKLVQLTQSEYGLILHVRKVQGSIELHTQSITNMAWNAASKNFFVKHIDNPLIFKNVEDLLFGEILKEKRATMYNDYSKLERDFLPSGHPLIKRFLGIPVIVGGEPILILGVCNKLKRYRKKDIESVEKLMNVLAYLFIDLSLM